MYRCLSFLSLCLALLLSLSFQHVKAGDDLVFFGTFSSRGDSEGIYVAKFDSSNGTLSEAEIAAEAVDPSFVEISPSGDALFSVERSDQFDGEGAVAAYTIVESGALESINRQASGGEGPCHVSLSPDGESVAVANYGSGSVASYRVDKDGSLAKAASAIQHKGSSINEKRQAGPHAHSINFSPDGKFAYAADLGADRIFVYSVNSETAELTPVEEIEIEPGSGPRHFCFRPDGKFAYVINEMALTVTAFRVDSGTGGLEAVQTISTLPAGTEPIGSTAEVVCHPSGKFLYGSNRGHDTIVVYAIDADSGRLDWIENEPIQGETPRNFAIHPSGKWLLAAGQKSNTVSVFSIDEGSGELEYTGNQVEVFSPVCIRFVERN